MKAILGAEAVREMCLIARAGYEARGKQEAMGLLFGRRRRDGTLVIKQAVRYRCAVAARTRVEFNEDAVRRRQRILARDLSLEYLGMFHSHVDEDGLQDLGQSSADCQGLYDDPDTCVDAIVYTWPRDRCPRSRAKASLYEYDEESGLAFAIRVFGKVKDHIERLPLSRAGPGA